MGAHLWLSLPRQNALFVESTYSGYRRPSFEVCKIPNHLTNEKVRPKVVKNVKVLCQKWSLIFFSEHISWNSSTSLYLHNSLRILARWYHHQHSNSRKLCLVDLSTFNQLVHSIQPFCTTFFEWFQHTRQLLQLKKWPSQYFQPELILVATGKRLSVCS